MIATLFSMRIYFTILIAALLVASTGIGEAIVMEGRELTIEVTKSKDSNYVFDVVNLKTLKTAEETAKWCFSLHQESKEKPVELRYSNSARLQFSEGFSAEEIGLICTTFMMEKIYPEDVTMLKDGRIVPFEGSVNKDDVLRMMGLSDEEINGIRARREEEERKKQQDKPNKAEMATPSKPSD